MQDIRHLIKIHASSERVYEAITTADGIRQWWTRDAQEWGHPRASPAPKKLPDLLARHVA